MSFSSRHFGDRFAEMGDVAESAFEKWAEQQGISYVHYGLNRPPFRSFYKLPVFIRMTPDFLCEGKGKFLVETKGSSGKVVKIKLETMEVLREWDAHLSVWFFVYDSTNNRCAFLSYAQLFSLCEDAPVKAFTSDQKKYYHLLASRFEWQPMGE